MDFKTYLRGVILLPKTGNEASSNDYDYPEGLIGFLNLVRDHYTKYHTTFCLFYPEYSNMLVVGGSVPLFEKAVSVVYNDYPWGNMTDERILSNSGTILSSWSNDVPNSLRNFILLSTLGFITTGQTMTSTLGASWIGTELDKNPLVTRFSLRGANYYLNDVLGTYTASTAIMPTSLDVINAINDILLEAYNYYNAQPVAPSTVDIYDLTNSMLNNPYSTVVSLLMAKKNIDLSYIQNRMIPILEFNYGKNTRKEIPNFNINGSTNVTSIVRPFVNNFPNGYSNFNSSLGKWETLTPDDLVQNDEFKIKFKEFLGNWFELKEMDVAYKIGNFPEESYTQDYTGQPVKTYMGLRVSINLYDPDLKTDITTYTKDNPLLGNIRQSDNSLGSVVLYFTSNNTLIIEPTSISGTISTYPSFKGDVPLFTHWIRPKGNDSCLYIVNTKKETVITRKDNGSVLLFNKYWETKSDNWVQSLFNVARSMMKNDWLLQDPKISPYVKFFTGGKVTLEYLKAIQVRDTILKSDKGKDLYLFPAFLISNPSFLTDSPTDPNSYIVDSVSIKSLLASAVAYIEGQVFAQDIALLNLITDKFNKSININAQAKSTLDSEKLKLDTVSKNLDAQILKTKQAFTTLAIIQANLQNKPDPVSAYINLLQSKMDSELSEFTKSETDRINTQIAMQKAALLQSQLEEQQRLAAIQLQNEIDAANLLKATQLKAEEDARNAAIQAQMEAALKSSLSITPPSATIAEIPLTTIVLPITNKTVSEVESKSTMIPTTSEIIDNGIKTQKVSTTGKTLTIAASIGVLSWLVFGDHQG